MESWLKLKIKMNTQVNGNKIYPDHKKDRHAKMPNPSILHQVHKDLRVRGVFSFESLFHLVIFWAIKFSQHIWQESSRRTCKHVKIKRLAWMHGPELISFQQCRTPRIVTRRPHEASLQKFSTRSQRWGTIKNSALQETGERPRPAPDKVSFIN